MDTVAKTLFSTCNTCLYSENGVKALEWLHNRGLTDRTIKKFELGYNPVDHYDSAEYWGFNQEGKKIYLPRGLVIPNYDQKGIHAIKIRRPQGKPKYLLLRGSRIWIFGASTCQNDINTAFLYESELDALLGYEFNPKFGHLALPAGQLLRHDYGYIFQELQHVVVMADNDEPGLRHAKKMSSLPGFSLAPNLPIGKDLTEYFRCGGDVLTWLQKCVPNNIKVNP